MADERLRPLPREWTPHRVAETLVPLRDHLVERLPAEIAAARGLTRDQRELIIDEAIDFMVTEYARPIPDRFSLDRAFWAAASFRVRRTHEGRGATVRAGWRRVDVDDYDLAGTDAEPEAATVERIEQATLLEFAATLTPDERHVLGCKYDGDKEQGRVLIARRLGLAPAQVRRAERSIARKLERFAAIVAAGSLCSHREASIFALAEGADGGSQEQAARMHLHYCGACRAAYAAHLHAVRTGELQRRLGQLLPVPATVEARRRGGPWETVWDWITRPFVHESTVSFAQVATASRGVGATLTAKLAAICLAGGAVVGAGTYCVSRLGADPPAPAQPVATSVPTSAPHESRLPSAGRSAALRKRPAPKRVSKRPRKPKTRATRGTAFASGPVATRHEREAPISPPATTTTGAAVPEFGPAPANTAPAQPAAAPATGASEFP
jgi:hypothetical protein